MRIVVSLTALGLVACGGPPTEAEDSGAAEASGGVIGAGYVEALDRAETVDELARERKDRLDDAVAGSE
jgi:hypothetical protein